MLGFACICKSLDENGRFKAVTVKTLTKLPQNEKIKKLKGIAADNIYNTLMILTWCMENDIRMYRASSTIIPLATYEIDWNWWEDEDLIRLCGRIKDFVEEHQMRLSMHPDHFCVINSDKEQVVSHSIKILEYHNLLSNLMGGKVLVIHVGSSSGGKTEAIERFKRSFELLDEGIKNKLVIENDDKTYTASEVLELCEDLGIPMVLDLHHHRCNNTGDDINLLRDRIIKTWKERKPKLHLSSGKKSPTDRDHSDFITPEDYLAALEFAKEDFDIMIEAKEKDLALLKLRRQTKETAE